MEPPVPSGFKMEAVLYPGAGDVGKMEARKYRGVGLPSPPTAGEFREQRRGPEAFAVLSLAPAIKGTPWP
jgi:hypothetical protein